MSNGHKLNGYGGGADGDDREPGYKIGRGHLEPGVMAEGSSDDRPGNDDTPRKDFPMLNPFTHKMHLNLLQKIQVGLLKSPLRFCNANFVNLCGAHIGRPTCWLSQHGLTSLLIVLQSEDLQAILLHAIFHIHAVGFIIRSFLALVNSLAVRSCLFSC